MKYPIIQVYRDKISKQSGLWTWNIQTIRFMDMKYPCLWRWIIKYSGLWRWISKHSGLFNINNNFQTVRFIVKYPNIQPYRDEYFNIPLYWDGYPKIQVYWDWYWNIQFYVWKWRSTHSGEYFKTKAG